MKKVKITLSYDGSEFHGSQIQPNKKTVHGVLDEVFRVLNIDTKFDFSGRTDRDVHAFRQVVSCEIPNYFKDLQELKKRLTKLLPASISLRNISYVDEQFHARFSAKKREYRYLFSDKNQNPFNSKYISYFENIDKDKIDQVIKLFEGEHDFFYFSKTGSEPNSTIRKIYKITCYQYKDIYVLHFCANSYLRSQIRMIVEAIMKVSCGVLSIEDIKEQLERKKQHTWTLASPNGLYLSKVIY